MMLTRKDYPSIGETLWTGTLPNGLRLRIVPKPGFATTTAELTGALPWTDRASTPPRVWPTIWSTRCSICPTGTTP